MMRIFLMILLILLGNTNSSAEENRKWLGSWGASPAFNVGMDINNVTIRQKIRLSKGGEKIRLRFSNETGNYPVRIQDVTVAYPGKEEGSVSAGSIKKMTFNGATGVVIPPGAPAYTDAMDFATSNLQDVVITAYFPERTGPSVIHPDAQQISWLVNGQNVTTAEQIPSTAKETTSRYFLTRAEVLSEGNTLVTLGDSITDGFLSGKGMNNRWPDHLAKRFVNNSMDIGIVNSGISGNRLLNDSPARENGPNALSRIDRDVLSVSSLKWVVILLGINDIGMPGGDNIPYQDVSTDEIISGLSQIIQRVKIHGVKAYCATLTPFGAVKSNFFSPDAEKKRVQVNDWIKAKSQCDSVLDFDLILRDEKSNHLLKSEYDSGDGLHPNGAGFRALAEYIDLKIFR